MIYLAVLVPLSATLYCKPRPLLCPVFQTVQYQDEWQNVTEIVVFPINQILLNTVFQVSDVPVTSVTVQTVTAPALQLVMIEVKVVEVTKPLMVMNVDTVTTIEAASPLTYFYDTLNISQIQCIKITCSLYRYHKNKYLYRTSSCLTYFRSMF